MQVQVSRRDQSDRNSAQGTSESSPQNKAEESKDAQQRTEDTRKQVELTLPSRDIIVEHQNIEGKVQDVKANERPGATKNEVADKAGELILGNVEHDISRAKPLGGLSFNQDDSQERIGDVRKAILDAAEAIAKKQEETLAAKDEARRVMLEREREAQIFLTNGQKQTAD